MEANISAIIVLRIDMHFSTELVIQPNALCPASGPGITR
jgi:hypothetical protein